jgi:putative acetyltransferase
MFDAGGSAARGKHDSAARASHKAVVQSRVAATMNKSDRAVRIEAAATVTEEARSLIRELETVLSAEYPPEQRHGLALDATFQPRIRFFLARLRGAAVGCGGVALYSDFAEVKRMYVRHVARGQGVADAILARLEEEVRGAGLSTLRLETGDRQVAAMRLYERAGFRPCPPFGAYALMAPQSIATSVFFEKRICPDGDFRV